jgi:hypothetical protein
MRDCLQPGETARLEVLWRGEAFPLIARGAEPLPGAIVYFDWQLPLAGFGVLMLLMFTVTLRYRGLVAMWRPIQMIPEGLGLVAILIIDDLRSGYTVFYRLRGSYHAEFPWVQLYICLTLLVAFVVLSICDAGCIIANRQPRAPSSRETDPEPV